MAKGNESMRILYIANHGCGHNDDEGSIKFALESLGHKVKTVHEKHAHTAESLSFDFALYHKLDNPELIAKLKKTGPIVFWYFDLVNTLLRGREPKIERRNQSRIEWMAAMRKVASLGFCTDGDWVVESPRRLDSCDLIQLSQGFDERLLMPADHPDRIKPKQFDIYFPGTIKNCGTARENWLRDMERNYGKRFRWSVEAFREDCRHEVDQCHIAIAPPFPITDRYYSNRVYNLCGYGAPVMHPYSAALTREYEPGKEIMLYQDQSEMHAGIDTMLSQPEYFQHIGQNAQLRTMKDHTYRHRCERLIETVKDRFDIC